MTPRKQMSWNKTIPPPTREHAIETSTFVCVGMVTAAIQSAQMDSEFPQTASWSGHVLCVSCDPLGWWISTSLPAACESPRRDAHNPPHRCRPALKISCRHGAKRDPTRLRFRSQPTAQEFRPPALRRVPPIPLWQLCASATLISVPATTLGSFNQWPENACLEHTSRLQTCSCVAMPERNHSF